MVEGKGFVGPALHFRNNLRVTSLQAGPLPSRSMGPLPRVTQGRGRTFPCVRGSQGSIPSYQVPLGVRPISWLGDLVDVGLLQKNWEG